MSYSNIEQLTYNPDEIATDVHRVRLAIGDTEAGNGVRPDARNFSDTELSMFVTASGSWVLAVTLVLNTLANEYAMAGRNLLLTGDPEKGKLSDQYAKISAELRAQAKTWQANTAIVDEGSEAEAVTAGALAYGGNDATNAFFQLPPKGVL